MKIAVIGSGIAGLSAALILSQDHDVTLFEKENKLGGHAHTINVRFGKKKIPVDTGFMVYNPSQYPNLVALFKYLSVKHISTNMSFSVSVDNGAFEFSSTVPNGVFADRSNIIRLSFYQFLLEIHRFNSLAQKALKHGLPPTLTLKGFLRKHKLSKDLEEKYLLPMVGSIWSTPKKITHDFPAGALLKFLDNHHLLQEINQPQWNTVKGGSVAYVTKIERAFKKRGGRVRSGSGVTGVTRKADRVLIRAGKLHEFDYVVFATHADTTLTLLKDATRDEKRLFSKFKYEPNQVYVHSDPSLMPRREVAWTAWNYLEKDGGHEKVTLTYWMNLLQSIDKKYPIFITLNPFIKPNKKLVHEVLTYEHPLYSVDALKAQGELHTIQNIRRTLFCGSYFGYGFHEDGISSGINAALALGGKLPWKS